jgi:hypothetical protein
MNIDELTIKQARDLCNMMGGSSGNSTSVNCGETVYIRTVTHHYIGRIIAITDTDFKLENASWVADSGRWSQALNTGLLSEVEPYPDTVCVMRGAIVDLSPWTHDTPTEVK